MYFIAFSHACPEFTNEIPINRPEIIIPSKKQQIASNPPIIPAKIGHNIIIQKGIIIALIDALVQNQTIFIYFGLICMLFTCLGSCEIIK